MAVERNYLVIAPLPVVVEDAGVALSYSPGQIFSAPDHLPSVVGLLADAKIVETTGSSTNGFTVVVGPAGPTGPQGLGGTLASTLLQGNTTGGTNIVVSDGDDIVMGGGAGPSNLLWNGPGNIGSTTMGERPDTIYVETSVVVGNTITITTNAVTGSTALALNANTRATLDGVTSAWIGSFSPAPIQIGLGNEYPQAIYEVDPNALIVVQPGNATVAGTYVWLSGAWAGTANAGGIFVEGGYGNALRDAGNANINGGAANGGPLAGEMVARGGDGGATAAGGSASVLGGASTHASLNAGDVLVRGGPGGAPTRHGRAFFGDQNTRSILIGDAALATQVVSVLTGGTIDIRSVGALGLGIGATNYFTISAAGAITAASEATQDLTLGARGTNTNLNQAGQVALHTSYTTASRNSIIGALNAIADGTVAPGAAQSLANVLLVGNTTGASDISINTGRKVIGAAELALEATGANHIDATTNSVGRVRVGGDGAVRIGAITATAGLFGGELLRVAGAGTSSRISIKASGTGAEAALLQLHRSRGAFGSETPVVANDQLGAITMWGSFAGDQFGPGISIAGFAEDTFSASSAPSRLGIWTTPTGTITPVERMRINSAGTVIIGATMAVPGVNTDLLVAKDGFSIIRVRGASATADTYPGFITQRQRGSIAAPTAVTSGDLIGRFVATGYIGATTTYATFGHIDVAADGAPTDGSSAPGRISFHTAPTGTLSAPERMRINSAGEVSLLTDALGVLRIGPAAQNYAAGSMALMASNTQEPRFTSYGASATQSFSPAWQTVRSRGTVASPTNLLANDRIGLIAFTGLGDTAIGSGLIICNADAAFTAGSAPTRLSFFTTPTGSQSFAERMRISAVKTVAIGDGTIASFGANAVRPFQVYSNASTVDESSFMQFNATAASAPALLLMHARGTAAAPTVTISGDTLGHMYFCGAASTTLLSLGALISSTATATHAPSSYGGDLRFSTSANGASTLTERMRIGNAGHVSIAHTIPAAAVGIQRLFVGDDTGIIPVKYQSSHASGSAGHYLQRSRGSLSAQTAVLDGDTLGFMSFLGYVGGGGDGMLGAGSIACRVEGAPSLSYLPGMITFSTSQIGVGLTERMRIDSAGNVNIGDGTITASGDRLFVYSPTNTSSIATFRSSGTTSSGSPASFLVCDRSRGTTASPAAVLADDRLGVLLFRGFANSSWFQMASIQAFCDGTPGASDYPGRLAFFTTPDGGANEVERWRINNAGHLLTGPADNTYDIGASGATRPRRIYVGTEVVVGNTITISTDSITGSGSLEVASDASQDLTLRGRGTGTTLNQSGQLGLHTSYTAASRTSLVGAINSLVDGSVGVPPEVYTTNEGEIVLLEAVLPPAVLGDAERSYYVENSNGIELTAAPGEFIRLGSVIGLGIRGVVVGTLLVLRPINGTWVVKTITGAWTMTGENAFEGATALWQLDDGLVDTSGNGHNLTFGGGSASYGAGKVGNAVFVGIGSGYAYNAANGIPSMQSSDFTIMGWVNLPSLPGDNMSVFNRGAGGFNDIRCYIHADGRVDFWANSSIMQTAAGKITAGNWHHICVRRIGTAWQIRVDNVVSATHSGSVTVNTSGSLHFAVLGSALGSGQSPPANTLFDQWAVFMSGIDNADIDAIYNVGNGVSSNETSIAGADAV